MKPVKISMLIALPFLVPACSVFSPASLDLDPPPAVAMAPCPSLQSDPGRALSQAEAEIYWGRDRSAWRSCNGKHEILIDWIDGVTAELGPR